MVARPLLKKHAKGGLKDWTSMPPRHKYTNLGRRSVETFFEKRLSMKVHIA